VCDEGDFTISEETTMTTATKRKTTPAQMQKMANGRVAAQARRAAEAKAAADATCPRGGEHEWDAVACVKCHEPTPLAKQGPALAKKIKDVGHADAEAEKTPGHGVPGNAKRAAARSAKASKLKEEPTEKKMGCLEAAAIVLAKAKDAMSAPQMIEAMVQKKLWSSPGGKTPAATLYSAIITEIRKKGKDARFKKTDKGRFAAS
jgi:hypothetical protein